MDCAVVVDILQFGSTALFDVGVDVDPSDNNNIVGVIRTPQPHSHLTAPSLFSPPSQPAQYKVCCPKLNYFIQFPTLSHSLHCQQTRRGRRWSAGNASVTSSSLVYEEIQVISNKLTPQSFTSYTSWQSADNFAITLTWYFDWPGRCWCSENRKIVQRGGKLQNIEQLFSAIQTIYNRWNCWIRCCTHKGGIYQKKWYLLHNLLLLRWFQDDGRFSWRPNTTKFITNTISPSYRYLQDPFYCLHCRQMDCGTKVTQYLLFYLQSSFRYVNWRSLMRKLFGGAEVQSSQLFLVHFPSFLRQLDRMVSLFGVRFV